MEISLFKVCGGGASSENEAVELRNNELLVPQHNQQRRRSSLTTILYDLNSPFVDFELKKTCQIKPKRFTSPESIRQFWKKIITEQIILIKMDHENRKLKMKVREVQMPKRRKRANMAFKYEDDESTKKTADDVWERYLTGNVDVGFDTLRTSVLEGVSQANRDAIWLWLAKQYNSRNSTSVEKLKKNCNGLKVDTEYTDLLKESTTHQHAIMLDLPRTFPNHPHFSQQFGSGQLALFNVLKAYSIFDEEVGYCQVVAVLGPQKALQT